MLAIATPNASFSSSITSLASVSSETSTSSSTLSTPSTSACVKCHPAPDKAPLPSRSLHRRFSHPNDSLSPRDYPTESNNNQTLKEHRKNVHLNKKLLSNQPSQNQLIVSGTEDMQPQLPLPPNHHLHFYRNSLRTLFVRKLKETSINEPLMQIGRHATKLKRLDVYICDHFTDRALYPFLAHKTLTYLSLAGCHRLTDVAVLRVSETCTMLEHLDLRACGLVSDVSISAIATRCPRLRHLNVGRIRDRHRITVRSITLIAKHTKATVLGLAGCDIDDECMRVLAHYRRAGLERVSVNNCQRLTNATIYSFIKYCPNLSVFEMKECHLINDWEAVAELVHRKVLLTLCDRQNRACTEWAQRRGRPVDVKAPLK
ncbi:uncharacterized protein BYT42DRAFT_555424 [Radiomyces spectabilis]|uniref:uncharacterized protein n=1 Tax=Radiomyces spectabilis TaxID=64574 RepID=UPI00221FC0B5|nr:uncharacterized protein BYT42DRAFT_555424 [Radiomyces spectabilis]KAI8391053.1 hypothetical protein BYT42DRAFT_555424 [Radiomyces spectabilis]